MLKINIKTKNIYYRGITEGSLEEGDRVIVKKDIRYTCCEGTVITVNKGSIRKVSKVVKRGVYIDLDSDIDFYFQDTKLINEFFHKVCEL